MEVTKNQDDEFPMQSEDDEEDLSELEDREVPEALNNNVTLTRGQMSAVSK